VAQNLDEELAKALALAGEEPARSDLWDRAEELARRSRRFDEFAAAARAALARPLAPEVLLPLAERAIAFHDEWIGDPPELIDLLQRVLSLDPEASWAFDRLSLELAAAGNWPALLAAYDVAIDRAREPETRKRLLEEAAQVAKDSAGIPERAVEYLLRAVEIAPGDSLISGALERLLAQQKRYRDLVELWERRLPALSGATKFAMLRQIAMCWLEKLGHPANALEAVEPLLEDAGSSGQATELLQQILTSPAADAEARRRALSHLGAHWDGDERWTELVSGLRGALEHAATQERVGLLGEIVRRLVEHRKLEEATDELAALVAEDRARFTPREVDALLAGELKKTVLGHAVTLDREHARRVVALAARVASERWRDPERAMLLLERIVHERPDDLEAIKRLAGLYEEAERYELLRALRRHELKIADSIKMRLYLRLEIARLEETLGEPREALRVLRENLAEQPNHEPSVRALVAGLEGLGDHAELADFLSAQAAAAERDEKPVAADLWLKAAHLALDALGDPARALTCFARVAALREDAGVYDVLARLCLEKGEPAAAAEWLSKRLTLDEPGARSETVLRLAAAQIAAARFEDATRVLREGLEEDPTHLELRQLLADQYRRSSSFGALAALLHEGAELVEEEGRRFELLKEAAQIFAEELRAPERAISVLEQARALVPADRDVRRELARSLRAAGRLDEARQLAQDLVEELGRRRTPERAELHELLADIAHAQGDDAESLRELELAASLDVGNSRVQAALFAAYRRAGDLPKAERAAQALLLGLRRQRGRAEELGIGVAETLFEIHRLAVELGDAPRAEETLASAFDTAAQSAFEAERLEAVLRQANVPALLLRALRQRLAFTAPGPERGALFAEIAEVLETRLKEPPQALAAWFDAIRERPQATELVARARSLAESLGQLRDLRDLLSSLAQSAEPSLASTLYLRAGEISEHVLADLDSAAELYARAEHSAQTSPEIGRAAARVARARGDRSGELSALRHFVASNDPVPRTERADACYRLAELELGFPDSLYVGLETLEKALEVESRPELAATVLRQALDAMPGDEAVIRVYERVAREAWNDELLLDALERRIGLGGATQALLEEAYVIAKRLERADLAEACLERAIRIARELHAEPSQALWALRLLVERRKQAGRLEEAVRWMREVADVSVPEEARRVRLEIAHLASHELGQLGLAADTYEALLDEAPGDASVWRPALEVVRRMNDKGRFERFLTKVAEAVSDIHARNQLRVAKARLLLTLPGRHADAIATLEQVLADDPAHTVAAELLADQLEKAEHSAELCELLEKQVELAKTRSDLEAGVKFSLRLGALHAPTRKPRAVETYRSALAWMPGDVRLLEPLHALLDPEADATERADVLERLLSHRARLAEEGGDTRAALDLALELVRARDRQGDPAGMERALEQAFRLDSRDAAVLGEFRRLAERLAEAALASEPDGAVELLQRAAGVHWNRLDDPGSAAGLLRRAHSLQPGNATLVSKLVRCLVEIGEARGAIVLVTQSLERIAPREPSRIRLLRIRSDVAATIGDYEASVEDLEEAASLGAEGIAPDLAEALDQARVAAEARGDAEAERSYTVRLADAVRRLLGDAVRAREVLEAWLDRHPLDREVLLARVTLDAMAGRFADEAEGYARLVRIEEGDAQVEAALRLADAHERAGTPDAARDTLESLHKLEPGEPRLRGRLRQYYERVGAFRELSSLILVEASYTRDEVARAALLREAGELRLRRLEAAATAIGPLTEAYELRPNDIELTVLLAEAYVQAGFVEDARSLLESVALRLGDRRSRDLALIQQALARTYRALGDHQAELSCLVLAWESFPQSGELASELAERAMELEDHERALKALRALAAMRTPAPIARPLALLMQARIAREQGDDRKAVFLAKKALSEDPELADAREFLGNLG
jgi:Flp pilus assembly protein TadD